MSDKYEVLDWNDDCETLPRIKASDEDVDDEPTLVQAMRTPTAPQCFKAAPISGEYEGIARQEFRAALPTIDAEEDN